jgi:hypothetical protein
MKLYIIGNGFDLHHGLNTSYYDFSEYIKEHDSDLHYTLERHISYPKSDKDLWAKFEANLANLDIDEIISENTDLLPDYSSDDFRDRDRHIFPDKMEEQYQLLTTGLFSAFKNFILSVKFPLSAYEYKLNIEHAAQYLTFNYTNTLERLYQIDKNQMTYIHNSVYNNHDDIILGHGIDPINFEEKSPEPPEGLNEEQLQLWYEENNDYDYSYDTGKESIRRYFRDTYKPTKEIITRNKNFFENLITVKEIFVLGHSISEVDLPYFQEIINSIPANTNWNVSFYNELEKEKHLQTLNQLGIEMSNIYQFELVDIQENNIQLKIDF